MDNKIDANLRTFEIYYYKPCFEDFGDLFLLIKDLDHEKLYLVVDIDK